MNIVKINPDQQLFSQNPVAVYLASLISDASRRTMQGAIEALYRLITDTSPDTPVRESMLAFPWGEIRYQHTQMIRTRLVESGLSISTINLRLSALRGVLKECWRLGMMDSETYNRATDIENVTGETIPAGRYVKGDEILRLLALCDSTKNTAKGVRDAAVIALLYSLGLRRAEIAALKLENFHPEDGALHIMVAKGRKQRVVYVSADRTRLRLDDWLKVRGNEPGPLFTKVVKNGRIVIDTPLSEEGVYDMLEKYQIAAGIEQFGPHSLRRTLVSNALEAGVDEIMLSNIVGHASVNTTRRYDRRPLAARRLAMKKMDLP